MISFLSTLFVKENLKEINAPINSLAPKILSEENDIEKIKPYLDLIKKTIGAEGVTNIALTGGYGSGKSTIIKTFQHRNPEYHYLNISLASFKDIDGEKKSKKTKGNSVSSSVNEVNIERQLEVSILQQIFYHVKPSEIPDSRFKRIVNITDNKIFMIAIGLILWVISTIVIFQFKYINRINPATWSLNESFDWISLLFFLMFFAGIGFFAKTFIRLFSNSKISKLNIKGELELGDNTDKSVFNEHLEEILYFFERTPYNVVVIEDLDRFDSTDIFTKLREINILLNNSKLITREINFLYAIKDEMFKDKNERVKFFEYIIPVIPFINPSTAGEQLTKMVNEAGLKEVLSKDFTEDIVTFIDDIDMRLLINIFHEYLLYKQNLIHELNQDNLFAIITYKNLFPDDFGHLQKRKGKLYEFISNKSNYIKSLIEKIAQEIKNKNIEIKNIEKETTTNIKELRAIYVNAIHSKIPNATSLFSDSVSFSDLSKDEEFEKLLDSENIHYNFYTHNYANQYYLIPNKVSNISFSDIENYVNPNFTYNEREQLILDKKENKTQTIKRETEKLKAKKSEIESWSLQQIFEEIDINNFIDGFANNELIRNLLLNGYINENYGDYISLFHEVNLTREDYVFEKNVKSSIHSDFDYKLTKTENLVSKINKKYFSRDAILNFDLLDFLADNFDQHEELYNSTIKLLSNEKERSVDFVFVYIDERDNNIPLLIKSICKSWIGFWDYIYLKSNFSEERIKNYLQLIIKHADLEDIVFFRNGSNIASCIMQQSDFLSLIKDIQYNEKIKQIIKNINVKFESLDPSTEETKDLFDYVYENNHYQINSDNIALMYCEKCSSESMGNFNKANYTAISNSDCQPLINYINSNINEYVKNVLLKISDNNSESEKGIISLLNDVDLKENFKFELIKKQNTIINKLSVITNKDIQKKLIEENKIAPDWNNLFAYYDNFELEELDETLIEYLNKETNFSVLTNKKLKENNAKPEDFIKEFSLNLIKCNELEYDSYIKLMKSTPYSWSNLNLENLEDNKVEWMINSKFISLSVDNFNKLKKHFPKKHISFLGQFQDLFVAKFSDYTLDNEDLFALLSSVAITQKNKIEIIKLLDNDVIIQSKRIASTVCDILSSTDYIELEYEVIESLVKHSNSTENRIKLLNKNLDKFSNQEITTLVTLLGDKYEEIFIKQHKPKFPNLYYNNGLFVILKNKGLIKNFEADKKDQTLLKVIANY